MISTELASAVLETKVTSVREYGNEIEFFGENFQSLGKYNTYEFANKCKKSANICNGTYYYIKSHIVTDMRSEAILETYGSSFKRTFEEATEPEAIIVARQWMLENIG